MGADTITVKPEAVALARGGVLTQLAGNSKLVEQFGSVSEALDSLGMWDFIENQAEVIATEREWTAFNQRALRAAEARNSES